MQDTVGSFSFRVLSRSYTSKLNMRDSTHFYAHLFFRGVIWAGHLSIFPENFDHFYSGLTAYWIISLNLHKIGIKLGSCWATVRKEFALSMAHWPTTNESCSRLLANNYKQNIRVWGITSTPKTFVRGWVAKLSKDSPLSVHLANVHIIMAI